MSLVLLADVKRDLKITGSAEDTDLQAMIDSAEATIAQILNAGTTLASEAITTRVAGRVRTLVLTRGPVLSITSVTGSLSGALTLSDLDIDLEHGLIHYPPLQLLAFLDPYYTVVYQVGYATLPPDLALAVKELVRHFWDPRRGPTPRNGSQVPSGSGYALPNRVLELLGPRMQPGIA